MLVVGVVVVVAVFAGATVLGAGVVVVVAVFAGAAVVVVASLVTGVVAVATAVVVGTADFSLPPQETESNATVSTNWALFIRGVCHSLSEVGREGQSRSCSASSLLCASR